MSARAAARLAWSLWVLSITLTALGLFLLALSLPHPNTHVFDWWLGNATIVIDVTVGAIVAARRPENPVGWLLCLSGVAVSTSSFTSQYAIYALLAQPNLLPAGEAMAWIAAWILPIMIGLQMFYLLLFPTGRLPSRRWRWLAWLTVAFVLGGVILSAFSTGAYLGSLGPIRNPLGIEGVTDGYKALLFTMAPLLYGAVALSVFMRLRRATGVERQQLKWFAYAAAIFAVGIVLIVIPLAIDTPPWFERAGLAIFTIAGAAVPISIGIAILRYRLYDIDAIINRTLVYGALTVSVVGIYVLVVGYLGALLRTGGNLFVSLLATGLVAVLFAPLRERLQRAADRLMYGERDEPYAVLSRLGERLEATIASEDVLPTIVGTIREALKLPYAAIALQRDGNVFEVAATSGEKPPADLLVLPLSYGGESVGELLLAPRAPGERFSATDRRLLDGLARHAGIAVHGVRMMADLQCSRERLVLAREEERRRLRRDLHDELAPTLAALSLSAATVGELILTDPKEAASSNEKLRAAIRGTVGDVRRLVYDLRPPALDELGLVEAIRERASRYARVGDEGFRATVEAPDELPPLPAAVEVASYRIVQEALTNVSRHARASACTVRLACTDGRALTVEVTDDGVGLRDTLEGGVGLSSMRERAAELGGDCKIVLSWPSGTRVFARLPLGKPPLEGRKE